MRSPLPVRAGKTRRLSSTSGRQAERRNLARTLILEATLECLVSVGYAQTTTDKIAKQAGLSRGAMMYHFKSSAALFKAAAKYITEKRAGEFAELIAAVEVPSGSLPTLQDMRKAIACLQQYYALPSFVALNELEHAARTDKSLQRALGPLEKALDDKVAESTRIQFPYWTAFDERREVMVDLVTFVLQGVAADPVPYFRRERLDHLLDLLAALVMREFLEAKRAAAAKGSRRRRPGRAALKAALSEPEAPLPAS